MFSYVRSIRPLNLGRRSAPRPTELTHFRLIKTMNGQDAGRSRFPSPKGA